MKPKPVYLTRYFNKITGEEYFGYSLKEAQTKVIDDELYIEVTSSLTKPKISYVRYNNLKPIGKVEFVPNDK